MLETELEQWTQHKDLYAFRGWHVERVGELRVELLLLVSAPPLPPSLPIAARFGLDYTNYDVEPPSLTFLDPISRKPVTPVLAPVQPGSDDQPHSLVPGAHPGTRRPFLCLPGILEYHTHPQHSGDDWLVAHRAAGDGKISVVAERLWQGLRFAKLALNVVLTPQVTFGGVVYQIPIAPKQAEVVVDGGATE